MKNGLTKEVIGFNHTCAVVVFVDKGEAEHVVVVKQAGECGALVGMPCRRIQGALEHDLGNVTHRLASWIGPEVGRQCAC